jgi:hypothetical protein
MSSCIVCCTCDTTADIVKRARKSGTNRVKVDESEANCLGLAEILRLGAGFVVCGVRVCISPCRTAQLYDAVQAQRRDAATARPGPSALPLHSLSSSLAPADAVFGVSNPLLSVKSTHGPPAGASAAGACFASAPSPLSQAEMK